MIAFILQGQSWVMKEVIWLAKTKKKNAIWPFISTQLSPRQYVNKWAWHCSDKTLFTKIGSVPDMACGYRLWTPGKVEIEGISESDTSYVTRETILNLSVSQFAHV